MYSNDLPDMSEALRQVYEKKKLDPVGKEDGDIDNDGDKDKTDSYLLNRRKTVTKALGKKTHICAKLVGYKKEEWETIPEMHTMLEDGTVTHYDIMREGTILHNVPVEELNILVSEKHEHFDNYDKNAEMLGEGIRDEDPEKGTKERKARLEKKRGMKLDDHPQYKKEEVEEVEEGKYSGSKSHIQRDGTAPAPERTAAERKKDRRILAGYGKSGMEMAVDRAKKERDERRAARKEAFAFSEVELEELALLEEIDAMSDEQLIDMMEDLIIETAEDIDDLIEICEHLEEVEMLSEDYYDSAVKSSKAASKTPEAKAGRRNLRMQRLKSAAKGAAKKVGAAAKKAGKAAVGAAGRAAGHAVGEYQAQRIKSKRAAMSRPEKKKEAPKSSSSDDDGTGGKLDALLAKTSSDSPPSNPSSSSSSSSDSGSSSSGGGGSSSSSSSSGSTRKAVGGALKKVGSLVKKGLKKAVGKTARVVSKGSDKLAKRLGEDYEQIADMYESGIFSIQEIENVVELYKGKHGQSEKQYQDSRSDGGKMVSGDSKRSGAAYSSRAVKNTGPNPAGGSKKPQGQGRMTSGARAELAYRKANMKKKD